AETLGVQHGRRRQRTADDLYGRWQTVPRHSGRLGRCLGQVVHRFDARAEEDSAGIDALRVLALTFSKMEGPPTGGPSRFFDMRRMMIFNSIPAAAGMLFVS